MREELASERPVDDGDASVRFETESDQIWSDDARRSGRSGQIMQAKGRAVGLWRVS
jgi:hypothetical protein